VPGAVHDLAILGGQPVRSRPWPKWPRADRSTEETLVGVLRSERWTISGPCTDSFPFERRFAEAFASFNGTTYCVPTTNGSSALAISLEALGVGPGKEVLIPGLTWVACGSAVARVGGIPILVDIDPQTLCMSVAAARQAITLATSAIMLVHLYCTVADLEGFTELSSTTGIPLIEDCSHAHGATWRKHRVGTLGKLGIFSMQQTKVLTSGEGGAVITGDEELYKRLQKLRADGRLYTTKRVPGASELQSAGDVQGYNHCLSEFHAALLLDRLSILDGENAIRRKNATYLTSRLRRLKGIWPLHAIEADSRPTFYRYCLRFDRRSLRDVPIEVVASALTAELGIAVQPVYDPLNCSQLFDPRRSPRWPPELDRERIYDPSRFPLPMAAAARRECVTIPQNTLLGDREDIEDIATGVEKIVSCWEDLRHLEMRYTQDFRE
jgi:dTDP-4-amino-4,6-dideoxygalactose transaminase